MNFAQRLSTLMDSRALTNYQLAKDLDIHPTTVTNWLSGKIPRKKTLAILSDYFGVSVDYLLGNEKQKTPVTSSDELTEQDKKDIAVELEQLMQEMENSGDLMFDGQPATPEAMESLRQAMELGLTYAKKINKGK